jgi:Transposase DDE domain.
VPALRRPRIRERDLKGFKYFHPIEKLLARLHFVGTARDVAGNRELYCDQFVALLLLYFFNPIVSSLRGLQQASALAKVQKKLGVGRSSLGSLSEATGVFSASCLRSLIQELAEQALPLEHGREAEALRGLTAVDGTLLPALPRMLWALWTDPQHHAAKMHLHFDVLKGIPADATFTPGACCESEQLRAALQPNRLYVVDRGFANYQLFREILDAGSSFVGRVRDNTAFEVE